MYNVIYGFLYYFFKDTDDKSKDTLAIPEIKSDEVKLEDCNNPPIVVKTENELSAKAENKEESNVSKNLFILIYKRFIIYQMMKFFFAMTIYDTFAAR